MSAQVQSVDKKEEAKVSESEKLMQNKLKEAQAEQLKNLQTTTVPVSEKTDPLTTVEKPVNTAQGNNQGQGASDKVQGKSEQLARVVDEDDIGLDDEEDVSPEEIHELELQLKKLEDEELKCTAINLKQWSESEQLRQLNSMIKKEKQEIESLMAQVEAQRQACREKQLTLAHHKIIAALEARSRHYVLSNMILVDLTLEHDVAKKEYEILTQAVQADK